MNKCLKINLTIKQQNYVSLSTQVLKINVKISFIEQNESLINQSVKNWFKSMTLITFCFLIPKEHCKEISLNRHFPKRKHVLTPCLLFIKLTGRSTEQQSWPVRSKNSCFRLTKSNPENPLSALSHVLPNFDQKLLPPKSIEIIIGHKILKSTSFCYHF